MSVEDAYSADRSLAGKLRRRLVRLAARRPARRDPDRPMVSVTFDDVAASAATTGAQILEAHGVRGAFFVSASLAGGQGPMGAYACRDQLLALAAAGHELACHTYSHLDCGQADATAIAADVDRNQMALEAWGAGPSQSFAYPYGDVSLAAKQVLGGRYRILRAVHPGLVRQGTDLNQAPSVSLEGPHAAETAHRWLDRAVKAKAWLILCGHDIADPHSAWGCAPSVLEGLVRAAIAAGCDVVTVAEGARRLA